MGMKKSFALIGIFVLLLAACGGGGGGKPNCPGTKDLYSISVEPYHPADIGVGATTKFTATGIYTDMTYYDEKDLTRCATWTSDDESVATVSKGVVTGVAVGSYVQITASYGSKSSYGYVDVVPTLSSIEVTPDPVTIMTGGTKDFAAKGYYDDGTYSMITYSVTWSSLDTEVATMSGRTATGKAHGTTTIRATLNGIIGTATLNVVSLTNIVVDPISAEVQETAQRQFTATANYSDGTEGDITDSVLWTSSDPAIAFISNATNYEGVATGMAVSGVPVTITASKDGITSAPASLLVIEKRPDLSVRVTNVLGNGSYVHVFYTVENTGLANSTGFEVDVWGDLASPPTMGAIGNFTGSHAGLDKDATLDGHVTFPSNLASGAAYAVVDTADSIVESEEDNNISAGYPWPYSHGCAGVVNKFGGTCQDITNGFKLTAPVGGYLSFGGYTFDEYANSGIGPKNVCSLALYGDGGVVLEHPVSASTVDNYSLPYWQHWYYGSYNGCGYASSLIDVGTEIDWTSYPVGSSCSGSTDTDAPTVSVTCTYAPAADLVAPASYDFNDGLFPTAFTNSGDAGWYNDGSALRSGDISGIYTKSCFAVNVAATNGVSFDMGMDAASVDDLYFYVDGTYKKYWSGTFAFPTNYVYTAPAMGTYEYKWCFEHDTSYSAGADAAWVDNISISTD